MVRPPPKVNAPTLKRKVAISARLAGWGMSEDGAIAGMMVGWATYRRMPRPTMMTSKMIAPSLLEWNKSYAQAAREEQDRGNPEEGSR